MHINNPHLMAILAGGFVGIVEAPPTSARPGQQLWEVTTAIDRSWNVAFMYLAPGIAFQLHRHDKTTEVYFFESGTGLLRIGEESVITEPRKYSVIPPGQPHKLTNTGSEPIFFWIISTPAYDPGDHIVVEET